MLTDGPAEGRTDGHRDGQILIKRDRNKLKAEKQKEKEEKTIAGLAVSMVWNPFIDAPSHL